MQAGLAWHYKAYEREQSLADRLAYGDAENAARTAPVGLWRDIGRLAPWDYRQSTRTISLTAIENYVNHDNR